MQLVLKFRPLIHLLITTTALFCTMPLNALVPNTATATLAPMLKKSMPSIVSIAGLKRIQTLPQPNGPTQERPSGQTPLEEHVSFIIGSGVIVDAAKGYIVTNAHLVTDLDEISITLSDKRKFNAKLLGNDKASDLALLQVQAKNLKAIKFADSDTIEVGDFVVAIGNPYGFNHTVTSGIISALGRTDVGFEGYYDFIQTDAAINVGNSGGGLLNLNGELIGINTMIISPGSNAGSIGLGFAIPSNMAKNIIRQLADTGHVDRGRLGVQVQPMTPELALAFGLKNHHGAIITDIAPNTPAEKAKLQVGDVIIKMNNKIIQDAAHFKILTSLTPTGKDAKLQLFRDGKPMEISVFLKNPQDNYTKGQTVFSGLKGSLLETTTPVNDPIPGVKVTELQEGHSIRYGGLQEGDIIVAANQQKTSTVEALKAAALENPKILLLQVVREKIPLFVAIKAL